MTKDDKTVISTMVFPRDLLEKAWHQRRQADLKRKGVKQA